MRFFLSIFIFVCVPFIYAVFPEETIKQMADDSQEEQEKKLLTINHKYATWLLTPQSLRNSKAFVIRFKDGGDDEFTRFLYGQFSNRGQQMLGDYRTGAEPSINLTRRVIYEINQIMMGAVIYNKNFFVEREENFSQETKTLLRWYLDSAKEFTETTEATVQLNRFLIEDFYSEEIWPLRRNIKENSLLSQAVPNTAVVESTPEQEQARFYAMYEGKTFHSPTNYVANTPIAEDPTRLSSVKKTPVVQEETGFPFKKTIIWILLAFGIVFLVYQYRNNQ